MAEQFTGMPGQYVPLKETLRGFKMILNGECDELPESCLLYTSRKAKAEPEPAAEEAPKKRGRKPKAAKE